MKDSFLEKAIGETFDTNCDYDESRNCYVDSQVHTAKVILDYARANIADFMKLIIDWNSVPDNLNECYIDENNNIAFEKLKDVNYPITIKRPNIQEEVTIIDLLKEIPSGNIKYQNLNESLYEYQKQSSNGAIYSFSSDVLAKNYRGNVELTKNAIIVWFDPDDMNIALSKRGVI